MTSEHNNGHGNIRDKEKYLASIPTWDTINGCFPGTKIAPTDIDGCVERKGNFLFLEQKSLSDSGKLVPIPTGQLITFKKLSERGDTVIVFWVQNDDTEQVCCFTVYANGRESQHQPANLHNLRMVITEWYVKANNGLL